MGTHGARGLGGGAAHPKLGGPPSRREREARFQGALVVCWPCVPDGDVEAIVQHAKNSESVSGSNATFIHSVAYILF